MSIVADGNDVGGVIKAQGEVEFLHPSLRFDVGLAYLSNACVL